MELPPLEFKVMTKDQPQKGIIKGKSHSQPPGM